MRHKIRFMLAAGCVSLVASAPALSRPTLRGAEGDQHAPQARAAASEPLFGWPTLVSEARKYMGTNPTARKRLWCATFMNFVLAKAGYDGTHSDAAKSFAYYGRRISEPKVGAIAVLSRGKRGGHVGVVSGIDSQGNPIIISGNHNKHVGEAVYPRARVIAYVMPTGRRPATTQLAARGSSDNALAGLDSPIAELLAAIEAEQNRAEHTARPAAPPRPAVPHRAIQRAPDRPAPQASTRHDLPLDPFLAELFGIKERAQPPQRPAPPQRQQHVQQAPGRVAAAAGLAKILGSSDPR
jgi:uncharacterized protein (TIGR02594 family)